MNYVLGGGGFNSRLMQTDPHQGRPRLLGGEPLRRRTSCRDRSRSCCRPRSRAPPKRSAWCARRSQKLHREGATAEELRRRQGLPHRQLPAAPRLDRQARRLPRPGRVLRPRRRLHRALRRARTRGDARGRPQAQRRSTCSPTRMVQVVVGSGERSSPSRASRPSRQTIAKGSSSGRACAGDARDESVRRIYLVRHGETLYNGVSGAGGDARLRSHRARGRAAARARPSCSG